MDLSAGIRKHGHTTDAQCEPRHSARASRTRSPGASTTRAPSSSMGPRHTTSTSPSTARRRTSKRGGSGSSAGSAWARRGSSKSKSKPAGAAACRCCPYAADCPREAQVVLSGAAIKHPQHPHHRPPTPTPPAPPDPISTARNGTEVRPHRERNSQMTQVRKSDVCRVNSRPTRSCFVGGDSDMPRPRAGIGTPSTPM